MSSKLWGGRFSEFTDKSVEYFTESISFDYRLAEYDVAGSIAHINSLKGAGIVTAAEAGKIIKGLKSILADLKAGKFVFAMELEDVHMNIETELIKRIGEIGKKLHTGRSRNDQVSTDMRLMLKDETILIQEMLLGLSKVLLKIAEDNVDVIMPGFTHLQVAQPVLLAHHILAYVEMFRRDHQRLTDGLERIDVLPLGSAALAGTTFNIDRKAVAAELGFKAVSENSMDAVSDRDFIIEMVSNISLAMVHLSRMSEDLIIWNSQPFGFVVIDDKFATGSSIMPQKKNPDIPELVRGKSARVIGDLTALLTLIKGLPLTYNRDLQEDKESLFNALDTIKNSLIVMTGLWASLTFDDENMRTAALSGYSTATDIANYLVKKKIPFRKAHEITGEIVSYAIAFNKKLDELNINDFRKFSKVFEKDIFNAISLETSVSEHDVIGGTAAKQVKAAIKRAKKKILGE